MRGYIVYFSSIQKNNAYICLFKWVYASFFCLDVTLGRVGPGAGVSGEESEQNLDVCFVGETRVFHMPEILLDTNVKTPYTNTSTNITNDAASRNQEGTDSFKVVMMSSLSSAVR